LKPHLQAMNGNPSLEQRYRAVVARVRRAAGAAGRDPGSVRLLAVSKTFPAELVAALAAVGQSAFGENYLKEALDKMAALAATRIQPAADERSDPANAQPEFAETGPSAPPRAVPPLEWHFIGPIQSNKTRKIAEAFDWVQSVDELRIAQRLSAQRPAHLPPIDVCLQVNISGESSKSGCEPDQLAGLALEVARLPMLRLRGVMAIPEPTEDRLIQSARFRSVRELYESMRSRLEASGIDSSRVDTLSMGMSADLEAAVAQGATLVRIGTALFGERPPLSGAALPEPPLAGPGFSGPGLSGPTTPAKSFP
jgi:pyridoxal phosphate enzyme (YggS family)